MSRPTKLTAAAHKTIVAALKIGAFKTHAAALAGIAARTLNDWLAQGAEGREPYASFALDVDRALATHALKLQRIITRAATSGDGTGNWRAAAWMLEKRFPKLYGSAAMEDHETPPDDRPFSPWKHVARGYLGN